MNLARFGGAALLSAALGTAPLHAQVPAPAAAAAEAPAPPAEAYSYRPDGRRDPFVSLIARGTDLRAAANRPAGLAGVAISELTIRGIVRSRDAHVAMIQAPDNRTYIVRQDDRVLDGTVKSITVDTVIFLQEVNDPLSLVKQREIRKPLRAPEEGW
jgi:Tfp pilus assembly protein PilP